MEQEHEGMSQMVVNAQQEEKNVRGEMRRDIVVHGDQQGACLLLADTFFGAGTQNSYLAKFVSAHNRSAVCRWHLFALRKRSIYSTGYIPICIYQ